MELTKLVIEVLARVFGPESASPNQLIELAKVVITALGPVVAALIVGVAGVIMTNRYALKRQEAEQTALSERARVESEAVSERARIEREAATERARIEREAATERARIERAAVDYRHQKDLEVLQKRYYLDLEIGMRSHAVELTKLEMERKLEAWKVNNKADKRPLRPVIQDFLAVYRDLQELRTVSPKELYEKIDKSRITRQKRNAAAPVEKEIQPEITAHSAVTETPGSTPQAEPQARTDGENKPAQPNENE